MSEFITILKPVISARTPSRSRFAEFFTTLGPQTIGMSVTGLPDLITTAWAIFVDRDTALIRLVRETDSAGVWEVVPVLDHPVVDQEVSESMRRVSLAFDQQAHPVTAFEDNGVVFVTQFDVVLEEHVLRPGWAGFDPVLAFDGAWSLDTPSSDVVVFYLSSDRLRLLARLQRETFTVENEVHVFSEPVILDRVEALLWRYQVLYTTVAQPRMPLALLSDWYDAVLDAGVDAVVPSVSFPAAGAYFSPIVTSAAGVDSFVATADFPTGGSYNAPVMEESFSDAIVASHVFPTSGAYLSPIIEEEWSVDGLEVTPDFPDEAVYWSPLAKVDAGSEGFVTSVDFPTGGNYEKP